MCPLGFLRKMGRLRGTDGIQKSLPIGGHHHFMMLSRHCQTNKKCRRVEWRNKKLYSGGLLEPLRDRNLGTLTQALFLSCEVTFERSSYL